MMPLFVSLVLAVCLIASGRASPPSGLKRDRALWGEMIANTSETVARSSVSYAVNTTVATSPATFSWADINGLNYLTPIRNQHQVRVEPVGHRVCSSPPPLHFLTASDRSL